MNCAATVFLRRACANTQNCPIGGGIDLGSLSESLSARQTGKQMGTGLDVLRGQAV